MVRSYRWGRALFVMAVIGGLLLVAGVVGERHLKAAVVRALTTRTGRQVHIDGAFEAHLLSVHPSLSAREVSVENPAWMPPGLTGQAGRVGVLLQWQLALPPLGIRRLEIEHATVHLARDAAGHANWFLHEAGPGTGAPLIRSLSMHDARVELHDERRHLDFSGSVSAGDAAADRGSAPLRIEGSGELNGRTASFMIDADPLAQVRRDRPYHFSLEERSGATHLNGHGYLEQPFDETRRDARPSRRRRWHSRSQRTNRSRWL